MKSFFDWTEAQKSKITPKIAHRKYGYHQIAQPTTDPDSLNFLELCLIFGD
jgi:hypothetical protein